MSIQKNAGKDALVLILPALIAMVLVHIIPIIWGIAISFINLNKDNLTKFMQAPFFGIRNFLDIFTNGLDIGSKFMISLWNILYFGLICMPIGYILALSIAIFLNKKFPGQYILRAIILLPWITPDSVMYNVWRFMFQARIGIINKYLLALGFINEPIIWLVGDRAFYSVVIANLWKGWPLTALILLAGIQNISKDLYEAATIDGANRWQRFRYITFPMLLPISTTTWIMGFIWNFHAFSQFYVLLGGDTTSTCVIPSLVILRYAFQDMEYGLGSAMSVVMLLIIFVLSFGLIMRKKEES